MAKVYKPATLNAKQEFEQKKMGKIEAARQRERAAQAERRKVTMQKNLNHILRSGRSMNVAAVTDKKNVSSKFRRAVAERKGRVKKVPALAPVEEANTVMELSSDEEKQQSSSSESDSDDEQPPARR